MRSRRPAIALLLFALLALVLWGWPRAPDPQAPPPAPAPPPDVLQVAAPEPVETPPPAEDRAPFVPEGPEQEALAALAEALGAGVIRCRVPADPDALHSPFTRSTWDGRTLVALVEEPAGHEVIRGRAPPRPERPEAVEELEAYMAELSAWREVAREAWAPRFSVQWGEAWAGEVGWCRVTEPRRVRISGRIVLPDGSAPDEEVWVNGCEAGRSVYADADGAFSFETWAGLPCTLEVRSTGMPGGQVVDRSADRSGLVLVWRDADHDMLEVLREHAAEADRRLAYEEDVHAAALAAVGSDAARAVLRGWRDARLDDLDEEAATAHEMLEQWERTPPP